MKFLTFLLPILLIATSSFAEEVTSIPFENTKSPDGNYAVGWGRWTGEPIDIRDPDQVIDQLVGENQYDNFIIEATSGKPLASTGTRHFAIGDRVQNHGSLQASWREDSRAVFLVEGGKWTFRAAILMRQVGNYAEGRFELIDLTQPLQIRLREYFVTKFPDNQTDIERWEIALGQVKWIGENQISVEVFGGIPKSEDGFYHEGSVTLNLPGADWVSIKA